jgi:hypothetical protein
MGCEAWSLTLREKRRLRVSENRVLRRVFGHKRSETTGEWRKIHDEELNDLYSLPNIIVSFEVTDYIKLCINSKAERIMEKWK